RRVLAEDRPGALRVGRAGAGRRQPRRRRRRRVRRGGRLVRTGRGRRRRRDRGRRGRQEVTSDDARGPEEQAGREPGQGPEDKPFHFTDKRKVDPETAQPRPAGEAAPSEGAGDGAETDPLAGLDFEPSGEARSEEHTSELQS